MSLRALRAYGTQGSQTEIGPPLNGGVHPWMVEAAVHAAWGRMSNESGGWVSGVPSSAESPVAAGFSINPLCLKPQQPLTGNHELMLVTDYKLPNRDESLS